MDSTTPAEALSRRVEDVDFPNVSKIVFTAPFATFAPRKLSSFLSEKDFEDAMSHFRTMLEACAFDPSERLGSGYGYDQPERKALVTDGKDVSEDVGLHFTYDVCYLHFDEKSLPGTPCVCLAADRQTFLNHKSVLERL